MVNIKNCTHPVAPLISGRIGNENLPPLLKSHILDLLQRGDIGSTAPGDREKVVIDSIIDQDTLLNTVNNITIPGFPKYKCVNFHHEIGKSVYSTCCRFEPDISDTTEITLPPVAHTMSSISSFAGQSLVPDARWEVTPSEPPAPKAASEYPIDLLIESFADYGTARSRLIHFLSTFSSPLTSIVQSMPKGEILGHVCLRTSNEIVWVHGNTYVQVSVMDGDYFRSVTGTSAANPLLQIAKTMNATIMTGLRNANPFATETVKDGEGLQPVSIGQCFQITRSLEAGGPELPGELAFISHTGCVIQLAPAKVQSDSKSGVSVVQFDFLALKEGNIDITTTLGYRHQHLVVSKTLQVQIKPTDGKDLPFVRGPPPLHPAA